MPEMTGPQQWQSDEMDVRTGTCFFYVKYLGCVEVFESRGMQVCEEALRKLNIRKKRPVKAILYVSGDGLRVVEDDTKGLIVDQTIEKVSFCAPDRNHDRGFSYICRDGTTRRWLCHGFLSLRDSGERLSHAVGCAFAVCLERKQKRDRECSVTMNFDPSSATFTRQGSFKQPSLTDRLHDGIQDAMNVKTKNHANKTNQLPAAIMAAANNTTSNNFLSTTTIVNINNINRNSKENIPIRTTPKINTKAIERPHASITLLQRQGSYRGLSHLNHTSPFKRQLSLRISELSSNKERTRSVANGLDPLNKTFTQFPLLKTPVSPILEMSPTHASDANMNTTVTANISTVSDQVNAMCQQLSQGLSLLSQNDNLFTSTTNNQFNSMNMYEYRDLLAHEADEQSSQQIELQPTTLRPTSTLGSTLFRTQQQSFIGDTTEQSLFHPLENSVTMNGDADVANNNSTSPSDNRELGGDCAINNNSVSGISSIENVPLTPPSTPPLQEGAQLPRPDQWLSSVAQLTLNVSSSKATAVSTAPVATTSASSLSNATAVKTHAPMETYVQPFSVSPAKMVVEQGKISEKSTADPFNIDWASISIETPKPPSNNKHTTNPFLTNSPCNNNNLSEQQLKTTCEVQI